MRTAKFWIDAAERAVRTFAQALVAALVSLLTSVAASGIGDPNSPALLPEAAPEPVDPDDY